MGSAKTVNASELVLLAHRQVRKPPEAVLPAGPGRDPLPETQTAPQARARDPVPQVRVGKQTWKREDLYVRS
jgi:hypothetical protein